jgi:hypothetical protein
MFDNEISYNFSIQIHIFKNKGNSNPTIWIAYSYKYVF